MSMGKGGGRKNGRKDPTNHIEATRTSVWQLGRYHNALLEWYVKVVKI